MKIRSLRVENILVLRLLCWQKKKYSSSYFNHHFSHSYYGEKKLNRWRPFFHAHTDWNLSIFHLNLLLMSDYINRKRKVNEYLITLRRKWIELLEMFSTDLCWTRSLVPVHICEIYRDNLIHSIELIMESERKEKKNFPSYYLLFLLVVFLFNLIPKEKTHSTNKSDAFIWKEMLASMTYLIINTSLFARARHDVFNWKKMFSFNLNFLRWSIVCLSTR